MVANDEVLEVPLRPAEDVPALVVHQVPQLPAAALDALRVARDVALADGVAVAGATDSTIAVTPAIRTGRKARAIIAPIVVAMPLPPLNRK